MTELHPTSGHQIMTEPFSKTRRMNEAAERRSIGRATDRTPLLNRSIDRNWEMFVIWGFVVVSFAAFFFAGYIIWVKCHSAGPY